MARQKARCRPNSASSLRRCCWASGVPGKRPRCNDRAISFVSRRTDLAAHFQQGSSFAAAERTNCRLQQRFQRLQQNQLLINRRRRSSRCADFCHRAPPLGEVIQLMAPLSFPGQALVFYLHLCLRLGWRWQQPVVLLATPGGALPPLLGGLAKPARLNPRRMLPPVPCSAP